MESRLLRVLDQFLPGARLIRSWPLRGGISAQMTAFEVERAGKVERFVARLPGEWSWKENANPTQSEFRLLTELRSMGIVCPEPVFQETEGHRPMYILKYIEGAVEVQPKDRGSFLRQYATALARLHQTDVSSPQLQILPRLLPAASLDNRPLNDKLREPEIRAILDSCPIPRTNGPVLCHGDLWPGNLLWRGGELVAIIDWEEALIEEPLWDLSICRLDLHWLFGSQEAEEFTNLYQSLTNVDLSHLPYWDLRASLRPMANIAGWAAGYPGIGRSDITVDHMEYQHGLFVARALRVLNA